MSSTMYHIFRLSLLLSLFLHVDGVGLLILYRPYDITNHCADSRKLKYDLSFGMGLSDTITLVFSTLHSADYECTVEIVADSPDVYLVISILYPNTIGYNCYRHPHALTVLKKDACFRVCDTIDIAGRDKNSPYFITSVLERFRFHFRSNSSINIDMNAHMYQVTATASRMLAAKEKGCFKKNETICVVNKEKYCFTSGVVCDGIKNCGVVDWFDERKSECGLQVEKLGFAPVFAVTAAILCAALAACHILTKCLPPLANSFFVFNANEDNRLCVDPVFTTPETCSRDIQKVHRTSLVPVSSDSSSYDYSNVLTRHKLNQINQSISEDPEENLSSYDTEPSSVRESDSHLSSFLFLQTDPFGLTTESSVPVALGPKYSSSGSDDKVLRRTNTMRSMTVKIQERLRAVTRSKSSAKPTEHSGSKKFQIHDI